MFSHAHVALAAGDDVQPCTMGTPAIITAIWRLNTAISRALIVPPAAPNNGLPSS